MHIIWLSVITFMIASAITIFIVIKKKKQKAYQRSKAYSKSFTGATAISELSDEKFSDMLEKQITPLHIDVTFNPPAEEIKLMIARGMDINAQDYEGNTPLHYCMIHNATADTVHTLLKLHADPTIKNNEGKTAHELASQNSHNLSHESTRILAHLSHTTHKAPLIDNASDPIVAPSSHKTHAEKDSLSSLFDEIAEIEEKANSIITNE